MGSRIDVEEPELQQQAFAKIARFRDWLADTAAAEIAAARHLVERAVILDP